MNLPDLRGLVKNPAVAGDPLNGDEAPDDNTTVQLFDLEGEFDIVYERPNGDQTVTLELDDPDSGISLNNANYPRNTGVVATIDDMALNVDPTGEDTWILNTDKTAIYSTAANIPNIATIAQAQIDRADDIADAADIRDTALADPAGDRDKKIRGCRKDSPGHKRCPCHPSKPPYICWRRGHDDKIHEQH